MDMVHKAAEFAVEHLEEVAEEVLPLLEKHWEELAIHRSDIKLAPDWERYQLLDEGGVLHIITARVEGVLVGYCVDLLGTHLHYKNNVFAINDIFFIDPEYRTGTLGVRMLKFAKKELKRQGVDTWMIHTKNHMSSAALLHRLGFETVAEQHTIRLGGE